MILSKRLQKLLNGIVPLSMKALISLSDGSKSLSQSRIEKSYPAFRGNASFWHGQGDSHAHREMLVDNVNLSPPGSRASLGQPE